MLLKELLGGSGLCCFNNRVLDPSKNCFSHKSQNLSPNVHNTIASSLVNNEIYFSDKFFVWHSRLGHASPTTIHKILELYNIQFKNKYFVEFCNACCLGKSHRLHVGVEIG